MKGKIYKQRAQTNFLKAADCSGCQIGLHPKPERNDFQTKYRQFYGVESEVKHDPFSLKCWTLSVYKSSSWIFF